MHPSFLVSVSHVGMPIGGYIFPHANYGGPGAQNESETARAVDWYVSKQPINTSKQPFKTARDVDWYV
jgi:hypothetical protein